MDVIQNKRVLVISHDYYPMANASTYCVEKMFRHLRDTRGCEITVVSQDLRSGSAARETLNGVEVFRVFSKRAYRFERFSRLLTERNRVIPKLNAILIKLYIVLFFQNDVRRGFYSRDSMQEISAIAAELKPEIIMSLSMPFANHCVAAKIKEQHPGAVWAVYELDPFAYNYSLPRITTFMRKSKLMKTYKNADVIISSDGIVEENELKGFRQEYAAKTHSLVLPNFEFKDAAAADYSFGNEKIHLVYAGLMQRRYRNPDTLARLLESTGGEPLELHYFGQGCADIIKKYTNAAQKTVFHGQTAKAVCNNATESADILINIGNTVPNQTPSKIFEYIASGKPIVSFYYNDRDTSNKYLSKYPLCMKILNGTEITPELTREFVDFCTRNRGKRVDRTTLTELYGDMLSENVREKYAAALEQAAESLQG